MWCTLHKVSFRTIGTMPLTKVCASPSRLQGLGGRKGDASPTYMLCYHMKGGGWASDPLVRNAYKKLGGPTKVQGAYKGSVSEELKEVGKGGWGG